MNNQDALLQETKAAYQHALVEGNSVQASRAIDQGLANGLSVSKLYLGVLMPAQTEVGNLWHGGQISVTQEHLASQITLSEMGRLRQLLRPKSRLGLKAAVAAVDGDGHIIGARVVADFLHMDGWDVDFLGSGTPTEDLLRFIVDRGVKLVGLSVAVEDKIPELKRVIGEIKSLPNPPKVLIGGPALASPLAATNGFGADGIAQDAAAAMEEARRICGLMGSQASLSQYLKGLGSRILQTRKHRKYSQQDLARLSGLDRAYISSVENGKQNLTIGAILRLADALDMPLEDLLVEHQPH